MPCVSGGCMGCFCCATNCCCCGYSSFVTILYNLAASGPRESRSRLDTPARWVCSFASTSASLESCTIAQSWFLVKSFNLSSSMSSFILLFCDNIHCSGSLLACCVGIAGTAAATGPCSQIGGFNVMVKQSMHTCQQGQRAAACLRRASR